ncbi:DUF1648 domain-containing protein [Streptomyces johnsoniae]|uniref:DUF1648 domain-containing protein n=1 Tax=Streptomyces johnsoniae TaxID=3075532 RepID=A0ABU2S5T9_9ACTN|nr:DUF1648 domain-containing protein [Streptomyces sp. DSM 41886]MDT0444327.1 DUF1648 domain-containing protein [Streptomyces sp. DSM 41886]
MAAPPGSRRRRPPWAWLVPSLLLLAAMTAWGAVRYPDLPDRLPRHIGPGGVDAWTDKTVLSAFVPVYLYAGVTLLLAACAAWAARSTPLDEMPEPADPWARAAAVSHNRPATAASARRTAKSLLLFNAGLGVALLPLCGLQWRTTQTADVPAWPLPVTVLLLLLSAAPLGVAWRRDAAEKKAA